MPDIPLVDNVDNTAVENINEDSAQSYNPYDYTDNLTAKLGGNYAKIIEFYDSKL